MFRKPLFGVVLVAVVAPAAWGGGFEFDGFPTEAAVDPAALTPFLHPRARFIHSLIL
jgi:hypothetical protein